MILTGDLSNLIGSLSRTIQQHSLPSEWIMCELVFFFHFCREWYDFFKVNKNLGLTFFKSRKDFEGFRTAFLFTIAEFCARWIVYKLPFIRVEEAVSWTQRFLKRKFGPKIEVCLWQTNLKTNVCRNHSFQVNRKKNATGIRLLTSSNRAAIFVSISCEERHNKLFLAVNLARQQKKTKLYFYSQVRKQFKLLTVLFQ